MADYVYLDVSTVKLKDNNGQYNIPVHGVASKALSDELTAITTLGNTQKTQITTAATTAKTEIETTASTLRSALEDDYGDVPQIKQDISSIKTLLQAVRDKLANDDIDGAIDLLDSFLLDGGELA